MMLPMEGALSSSRPSTGKMPKGLRLAATLTLAVVAFPSAYSQKPSTSNTQQRFALAVNKTLEQGHDASLPPHISHLLGISPDEQRVPVKQFADMGQTVRGREYFLSNFCQRQRTQSRLHQGWSWLRPDPNRGRSEGFGNGKAVLD